MATRTMTITHNDTEYTGQTCVIKSTSLGYESHGIFTAYLELSGNHWGVQVGGYNLQTTTPRFAIDQLKQILSTVGVETWENLKGKPLVAVFEAEPSQRCVGIAHPIEDRVLIFAEHAASFDRGAS